MALMDKGDVSVSCSRIPSIANPSGLKQPPSGFPMSLEVDWTGLGMFMPLWPRWTSGQLVQNDLDCDNVAVLHVALTCYQQLSSGVFS